MDLDKALLSRPDGPFVLLDNARANPIAPARLYCDPVDIIAADNAEDIAAALSQMRTASGQKYHLAGYMAYEAGFALEDALQPCPLSPERADDGPLLWFGVFRRVQEIPADQVDGVLAAWQTGEGVAASAMMPMISYETYLRRFQHIQSYIQAGDIYQANLTFPCQAAISGDPLALYAKLRNQAAVGYGGIVHDGQRSWLSFSPELFFTLHDGAVTTRPMKGTRARSTQKTQDAGAGPQHDEALAHDLANSVKDRAENLMIVDLLRNDLSRIAEPGSVVAEPLFAIEAYPSVYQMVSTVHATLPPQADAITILESLFPCGSITGAPKIRAMEILCDMEARQRGVYCGTIGRIDPVSPSGAAGNAAFNVAIRTLQFAPDHRTLTLGLGSGIVADSSAQAEWRECHDKGAFVTDIGSSADLIETMAFDPAQGIARLEAHLERMKTSAAFLGYEFDRHYARNAIHAACFALDAPARVRLLAGRKGSVAIDIGAMPPAYHAENPANTCIRTLDISPDDPRLRHKTTDRSFYDDARQAAACDGHDEVLFCNGQGLLTEGSFTHVFVERDGILLTPPLSLGLLPGILRAELIDKGRAVEAELRPTDLQHGFLLGNAVRGLFPSCLGRQ